jgi:hypothetical protein
VSIIHRTLRATRSLARTSLGAAFRFLGPVAGSIRGELSKQETVRALAKAVVVGGATRATLWASLTAPDALSGVVVPLAAAALTGVLDALGRLQQGDPPRSHSSSRR